jgi:hypothetical protein
MHFLDFFGRLPASSPVNSGARSLGRSTTVASARTMLAQIDSICASPIEPEEGNRAANYFATWGIPAKTRPSARMSAKGPTIWGMPARGNRRYVAGHNPKRIARLNHNA